MACHGALIDLLTNDDIAFLHSTFNLDSLFTFDAKDDGFAPLAIAVSDNHEVAFTECADSLRWQPERIFALFDDNSQFADGLTCY
jgi:hypothetical protein